MKHTIPTTHNFAKVDFPIKPVNRGERFQVTTRLTTVTRQTGEYKVDLTRHPKFGERLFSTLLLKNC
jgi:hypothetical protein